MCFPRPSFLPLSFPLQNSLMVAPVCKEILCLCLLSCLVCSVVVSENQGGSTWGITSDQQDTSSLARKELEDNFCSSHLEDQQMQLQTLFSCFIFFKRYKIKNLDLSCRDKSQHKAGNTMGTLVSSPKPFCLVKHCLFAEGMRREDHSGSHLWED